MNTSLRTPQGGFPDPQSITLVEDAYQVFAAVHRKMVDLCIATDQIIQKSPVSVRTLQEVMLSNAMAAELHDTAGKFFARIKELLEIELAQREGAFQGTLFGYTENGPYGRKGGAA